MFDDFPFREDDGKISLAISYIYDDYIDFISMKLILFENVSSFCLRRIVSWKVSATQKGTFEIIHTAMADVIHMPLP